MQGANNNIPGSALFWAGDSASRLSVGVAASHMRASERASERRGQEKKKGKETQRKEVLQKCASLSPAKRLLVGSLIYWD
jgi:hypothetical protein